MKLGIQPSSDAKPAPPAETVQPPLPEQTSAEKPAPPTETELNLAILGGTAEAEGTEMTTTSQPNDEPIDLAARLGSDSQPPAPEPATVSSSMSASSEVTSVPVSAPEETAGGPHNAAELLRLLRHPQTGQLIVDVAGQQYQKLTDINDREVGQYVLELAAHFLAFTNGVVATRAGVKSVYLPKVDQTPEPLVRFTPVSKLPDPEDYDSPPQEELSEPLVPPPSPEAEAAFLASLKSQPLGQTPPPPVPKSRGGFLGLGRSSGEPVPLSQFNLADEINQIVQARLLVSPLAATTNVEVVSDHSGGIRIKVNGEVYASPDDIPDPDVKALIKNSIKQWERS